MWLIKSAVVIVIFYLESLQSKAEIWLGLLRASLESVGVSVITELMELRQGVRPTNITHIREQ